MIAGLVNSEGWRMNDIDSGSNRTTSLRDIRSVEAVVRLGKVLPKLGATNGPSKRFLGFPSYFGAFGAFG